MDGRAFIYLSSMLRRRRIFQRIGKDVQVFGCTAVPPKSFPNSSKIFPKPPQILQNPPQIDPKSIRNVSWRPSWGHASKQIDFGGSKVPKRCQNGVPKLAKIQQKTKKNTVKKRNDFGRVCFIYFDDFSANFGLIFECFLLLF